VRYFDRNRHPSIQSETGENIRKKDRKSRTGITDQTRRNTGKPKAGTGESSVSKGIGRTRGRTTFYG